MKYYTKASLNGEISQREKQNFDVAYRAACESIVLLENDGALPLKNKTVALFGNGAKRTIKGGTGSGEVNERHSVNILEGLENAGFTVTTHRWINDYDELYTVKEKEFNDGKVIPLHLSVTVHPDEITLTNGSLYPMATTEQLNELLQSLDELFGPDAPITLQLPASDYTEKIVIPGRSVSLIGAAKGTVFRNGLRIDESADSNMVFIQNIVFQGDGSGTAIISQRNLSLSQCTFNDYDTCYTVPENIVVTSNSITGNVPFAEAAQPTTPDLTTAAGLNAYLSNPPGELANLPSYTIQLPAVTYTEEIVINRAVSLEGAPNRKTVFLAGLRYEGEGGDVLIRNCTFHSDGREAAVISSRNLQITECNICDFTYAAMPIGDAEINFLDCNFDMTDYLLPGSNPLQPP